MARLIREKQTRIQAAADARWCPLTLLLCLIEAIEVAFPRHAPRIFLSVNSLRGQSSHTQCDGRKRRESWHSNSDQELSKRLGVFELNAILVHAFSRHGCQTTARQNAFLYCVCAFRLP